MPAGCPDVRIIVSGGLDEHDIEALLAAGAPIDAFGIGTRLDVSADAPSLDMVYKLVELDGRDMLKLSPGKETWVGAKQVAPTARRATAGWRATRWRSTERAAATRRREDCWSR